MKWLFRNQRGLFFAPLEDPPGRPGKSSNFTLNSHNTITYGSVTKVLLSSVCLIRAIGEFQSLNEVIGGFLLSSALRPFESAVKSFFGGHAVLDSRGCGQGKVMFIVLVSQKSIRTSNDYRPEKSSESFKRKDRCWIGHTISSDWRFFFDGIRKALYAYLLPVMWLSRVTKRTIEGTREQCFQFQHSMPLGILVLS